MWQAEQGARAGTGAGTGTRTATATATGAATGAGAAFRASGPISRGFGRVGSATAALCALLIVAGCASPFKSRTESPTAAEPASGTGRYYLDDGPGERPIAELETLPDAVPREEPLHRFANRPYVVFGRRYQPMTRLEPFRERGTATWYGRRYHDRPTAIGERYDMYAMTAAHTRLPLPSYARVTNLANGRSVVVRVNDRGPFLHGRVIDLSYAAAARLGFARSGTAQVEVELIADPEVLAAGTSRAAAASGPGRATPASGTRSSPSPAPVILEAEANPQAGGLQASSGMRPVPSRARPETESAAIRTPAAAQPAQAEPSALRRVDAPAAGPTPLSPVVAAAPSAPAAPVAASAPVVAPAAAPAAPPAAVAPSAASAAAPAGPWVTPPLAAGTPIVQIGAYRSRDNAEAARRALQARLGSPGFTLAVRPEGRLFRLIAGPFPSLEQSRAAAGRIREMTGIQAFARPL